MMTNLQSLIDIAETHETSNLKKIQRHQRTRLMIAKRERDRREITFFQIRVDATSQVLANRKVGA